MRSAAPKFLHPCYFGTDVPSCEELVACRYSDEELPEKLGVDSIGFLSIENAKLLAGNGRHAYCVGCFSGEYPCEPPKRKWENKYLKKISSNKED